MVCLVDMFVEGAGVEGAVGVVEADLLHQDAGQELGQEAGQGRQESATRAGQPSRTCLVSVTTHLMSCSGPRASLQLKSGPISRWNTGFTTNQLKATLATSLLDTIHCHWTGERQDA